MCDILEGKSNDISQLALHTAMSERMLYSI
jgi:hypothetical protein